MGITILVNGSGNPIEATEQSTLAVTLAFTDEDGADVIPNEILWTLVDLAGNVINTREQEVITVPAAAVTIVLTGDDLSIQESEAGRTAVKRRLVIEAEYDSDLGDDLTLKDNCEFTIRNLAYVETVSV